MFPDVILTSQPQAGRVLKHPATAEQVRYIISIGEEADRLPAGFAESRAQKLRLMFDDIEYEAMLAGYFGCTESDVVRLVQFCKRIHKEPGLTLVHCAAGISRSSAAVVTLLTMFVSLGEESLAVAQLEDVRARSVALGFRSADTGIRPNRRMVAMAGQVMGRGDRILQACQARFKYSAHSEYSCLPSSSETSTVTCPD